jgi:hypothetical protein
VYEGSHCGRIANCLAQAKSMSMVLMFDELDKISSTSKGEEIQNLLVHMTDPVQNMEFEDKYLSGIPLDLSRTMLVFSGNDVNKIDKILMDRMVVVNLAGYETKDKIAIAEQFLLPAALKEVNLVEKVAISRDILQHILTNYAKEETGVRELKRCIEQIAQKVNMLRMFSYATRAAAQHGIGFRRTIGGENVNGRTRTGFAIGFPNHVKKFRVHFRRRIGTPVTQEPIQFFKHGAIILPIDTEGRGNALTCVNMIEIDRARIAISNGILCPRSRKSSRKGEAEGANRQKIAEASGGGFERHQAHSSTRGAAQARHGEQSVAEKG